MRKLNALLIVISATMFLVTASTAAAKQSSDPWRDGQPPMPRRGESGARVMERDREEMEKFRRRVETKDRTNNGNPNDYFNRELTPAQKKLLSPAPEDLARFAEFLKLPIRD